MSRAPRAIEKAVAQAVNAATWITPADAGTVRLAKRLAETLDDLYVAGKQTLLPDPAGEVAARTTYVAQTLLRALNDLGLTPATRPGAQPETASALDAIRDELAKVTPLPVADSDAS